MSEAPLQINAGLKAQPDMPVRRLNNSMANSTLAGSADLPYFLPGFSRTRPAPVIRLATIGFKVHLAAAVW